MSFFLKELEDNNKKKEFKFFLLKKFLNDKFNLNFKLLFGLDLRKDEKDDFDKLLLDLDLLWDLKEDLDDLLWLDLLKNDLKDKWDEKLKLKLWDLEWDWKKVEEAIQLAEWPPTSADTPPSHTSQPADEGSLPQDEVLPDQAAVSPKSDIALINQALNDVVKSTMTRADIVTILKRHGCVDLTRCFDKSACSRYPIANGGLGDVFRGQLPSGTMFAVKTICAYYGTGKLARMYHKRAAKEIYTWSKCEHPNVVKLGGLAIFRDRLATISRWEENGNLLHYLSKHPSANRCHLSTSICAGLAYLHENDIVHGDLKGANILIARDGRPMLDFGNTRLLDATLQFPQTNTRPSFSLRWKAPEILRETTKHTTTGDVYSLGMTVLETFTSEVPFADESDQSLLAHIVLEKRTPTRPETIIPSRSTSGNKLWDILTRCWALDPKDRPSARAVWDEMKPITTETLKELEVEPERDGQSERELGP